MLDWLQFAVSPAWSWWGADVTPLEAVAFVLALAMVLCNMRVHVAAWPLAISSSLLYLVLFAHSRLYGDAALQVFFALVAVWGWWRWQRDDRTAALAAVHRMAWPLRLRALAVFAVSWPLLGWFLARFTDTDVPWWDAAPTAGSLVGQWMLGRKFIENWPVWLAVNAVSVALFAYKALWLTVLLYAISMVLSVVGWRVWARLPQNMATA